MFISTNEVAERMGVSKPTIWRYRQRFVDFPKPISIDGAVLRWVAEEVDAWMLARRVDG